MNVDVLECPRCQGRMKPIAVIQEREVIEKILTHLRMPLTPEPLRDGTVTYDVTGEPILRDDIGGSRPTTPGSAGRLGNGMEWTRRRRMGSRPPGAKGRDQNYAEV